MSQYSGDPSSDDAIYIKITTNDGQHQVKSVPKEVLPAIQAALDSIPPDESVVEIQKKNRAHPLPPITSNHQTRLPGTSSFEVLTQSFGPSIEKQPSIWSDEEAIDLVTPDGILQVKGTSFDENTMLQQYVARDLGPEGLKHVAGLIDVYNFLTQGRNQKQDVKIAAKQVLQRLGYGRHADDKDLQLSLLNTTLYLARTFVVSLSSKRSPQRRYTPLLVLESFELSTEEGISFEYHLGQEFYDAIYGSKPQHYTIPTPRVIGYHAVKSQQELLLTFYLGQHLAQNQGTCSMYFITLCTRSTLYALEELQQGSRGKNRTRNAQQVIYALERMEQDGLILRAPHPDIDLVLAVNVCLDKNIRNHLAPATTRRIDEMMSRLKGLKIEELRTKRRLSLQRLLNIEASKEEVPDEIPEFSSRLTFYVGNLMQEKHPKQDSNGSSSVENVSEK